MITGVGGFIRGSTRGLGGEEGGRIRLSVGVV